jgi:hypothetical protein
MKAFSPTHFFTFLFLLSASQYVIGQDYLITSKGDSIYGEVKPFNSGPDKRVIVISPDKKKSSFSILQVRSYVYNGELYRPVRNEKGYSFMKLLKDGYLSLYGFQMENQVRYDGEFLQKKDGRYLEVPNLAFKKIMKKFLEDCTSVTEQIDSDALGKNDLEKIVDEYNACIETRTRNYSKINAEKNEQIVKSTSWETLEEKIKTKPEFEGKADALEMISEIKGKIMRNEKVPNFLVEGLKNALAKTDLSSDLNSALEELNK